MEVLIGAAALCLITVMFSGYRLLKSYNEKPNYKSHKRALSKAENDFYKVLNKAVGDKWNIVFKMRVADIIKPVLPKTFNKKAWWSAFSKISQKHVDFILLDRATAEFICCIELDDNSHNKRSRRKRDRFIDHAFSSAGIKVVHIKCANSYSTSAVESTINTAIKTA